MRLETSLSQTPVSFSRPFSNKYYKHFESGTYACVVCGESLFASDTKYESGSGWPSFYDITDEGKIRKRADASGGEKRKVARGFY